MTVKAATRRTNGTAPADGDELLAARPELTFIRRKELRPSPTNPRRRIVEETIGSLADSIRTQGILEPLIVRKGEKGYEIVCGERRYRAAALADMEELPCLVRGLTDEQVLDLQIHENLHREDVHPMDEAYGYRFLKEKLQCDTRELALRVGKSEGYVLNRLKLNDLIEPAQRDIDDGHLPLVFALEIAKYAPDIQELIYAEVYRKHWTEQDGEYGMHPDKEQPVPFRTLAEWINTNVHRLLSKAPFSAKATNLHPDGLACVKCPERTGASVGLFESEQVGKKDACLNPACFERKLESLVQVRRNELAKKAGTEPSEVPIVKSWRYADGEGYLGSESAIVIEGAKRGATPKKCRKSVSGIDTEADNYGRIVQVCLRSTGCKTHWPDPKASRNGEAPSMERSGEELAAEKLASHRARREEIWNAKVAEAVRVRVFRQAAENFGKKFRFADVGADLLPQLVARLWRMTASGDANNLNNVVRPLIAEWAGDGEKKDPIQFHDMGTAVESLKALDREIQHRILFLLVHCHEGAIGYGNSYASQKGVIELSRGFEVDYPLIDAEVRLEFCGRKHKEVHEKHLEGVKAKKEDVAVPHLYSQKWKPKD